VAPSLPQLPQVSQFDVSSTLFNTAVPAEGVGVGVATGVGLGLAAGLFVAAVLLPQEDSSNAAQKTAAKDTAAHRRKMSPPKDLVGTK